MNIIKIICKLPELSTFRLLGDKVFRDFWDPAPKAKIATILQIKKRDVPLIETVGVPREKLKELKGVDMLAAAPDSIKFQSTDFQTPIWLSNHEHGSEISQYSALVRTRLTDRVCRGFNADDDNSDLLLRKQIIAKYIRYNRDPFLNWDIIGDLGDGAFGKVRKVKHKTEPSKYAAAKAIELGEQERLEDFLTEIEILSECQHKNVVGLYEAYFRDNSLLLFLEYCEAGALDSIMIELEKPLNEPQIRYVCHELCDALKIKSTFCPPADADRSANPGSADDRCSGHRSTALNNFTKYFGKVKSKISIICEKRLYCLKKSYYNAFCYHEVEKPLFGRRIDW
uniref:Protein kinase domain-containing protein n=1 Tax=Romanomermis culicivorax TaxID=13658 RepID=A0A915K1L4_ROMCU